MKRYKAEYGESIETETEEKLKHDIEKIRDEMFNLPFEESAKEIVTKFQSNFLKLKDFMTKVDKEIANLGVFN